MIEVLTSSGALFAWSVIATAFVIGFILYRGFGR